MTQFNVLMAILYPLAPVPRRRRRFCVDDSDDFSRPGSTSSFFLKIAPTFF